MQVRGNVRRRNTDAGFALSDHADWDGLLQTVKETGAEKVFVTHGFQSAFSRYLNESESQCCRSKNRISDEEEQKQKEGLIDEDTGEHKFVNLSKAKNYADFLQNWLKY